MKFRHQKELQFEVKVDRPDPMLARQVQEVLGGQFGEMTVMMQYLSQGFNCRGEEKYKDMLMDIRRGDSLRLKSPFTGHYPCREVHSVVIEKGTPINHYVVGFDQEFIPAAVDRPTVE